MTNTSKCNYRVIDPKTKKERRCKVAAAPDCEGLCRQHFAKQKATLTESDVESFHDAGSNLTGHTSHTSHTMATTIADAASIKLPMPPDTSLKTPTMSRVPSAYLLPSISQAPSNATVSLTMDQFNTLLARLSVAPSAPTPFPPARLADPSTDDTPINKLDKVTRCAMRLYYHDHKNNSEIKAYIRAQLAGCGLWRYCGQNIPWCMVRGFTDQRFLELTEADKAPYLQRAQEEVANTSSAK